MSYKCKLSVIIPTCHRNDLLAKCLDCLAPGAQTLPFSECEVIVTDDGKQSTAQKMVEEKYPWATWVAGPRKGPAANRNYGATQAQGQWLVFTDDDCLPKHNWLQAYQSAIQPHTLVYEGRTTCEQGISSPLRASPVNLSGEYLWSCNMMIEAKLFERLSGFDTSFPVACCEDVEFRERLKKLGHKFSFIYEAVVDHPPRPQQMGFKMGAKNESQVHLWYVLGNQKAIGVKLILAMFLYRLREIKRNPIRFGSFIWLISTVIELLYVAFKLPAWNKKHRDCGKDIFKSLPIEPF